MNSPSLSKSASTRELLDSVRQSHHPLYSPSHLSSFVINTLFNVIVGAVYSTLERQKFVVWFNSYR